MDNKEYCESIFNIINADKRKFTYAYYLAQLKESKEQSFVYFIEDSKRRIIKIGKSSNLKQRMSEIKRCCLQIGIPTIPLECRAIIYCANKHDSGKIEKEMHSLFEDKHYIGEWFKLSQKEILDVLNEHFGSPLQLNNISIFTGLQDISEMKLPQVIEYNLEKYKEYLDFISTHSQTEYSFRIRNEYGIHYDEIFKEYEKFKDKRLDEFILEAVSPIITSI